MIGRGTIYSVMVPRLGVIMSIGNNTFWIIVSIPDGDALVDPKDQRRALRFTSSEGAQAYMQRLPNHDPNFEIVVRVRG